MIVGVRGMACGGGLERVHRHALDRFASIFRKVHRYRCLDAHCGWHGLLGRDSPGAPASPRWRTPLIWFVIGATSALAAVQVVRMVRQSELEEAQRLAAAQRGAEAQSRATPPGEDFTGAPLPPTDARVVSNPSPLRLRRSCAWGVPGANPYRGTVEQALAAAQLPEAVARQIADMAARGKVYEQVAITRNGIHTMDGRRDFGTYARAMAFGDTLCFNTRVNFPAGHTEYAALYQTSDDRGKAYAVMVPYVCGNVSVLGEREEIDEGNGIPEPAGWTLVLLGLAVLAWQHRQRSRAGPP
jgi:hypothetical protein